MEESATAGHARWTPARSLPIVLTVIELPTPTPLSPFVRSVRAVAELGSPAIGPTYRRLPDGELELVVRFGVGASSASVVGARTRVFSKPASNDAGALAVRFRVGGAYPFFGRPISELTDQVVPLAELWDRETCDVLANAHDAGEVAQVMLASLTRVLASGRAYEPWSAPSVRRGVRAILASPRLPRVAELASALGLSERQLRRLFPEVVGVGPKRFLRIVRFRRALRAAREAPQLEWAAIAARVGYFDHAHLVADFRALAGTTPSVLAGRVR